MSDLQFHAAANIFPFMSDEEFTALKADIAEHGQREPIWLHDGRIIDGRNRYKACIALGVTPKFRTWDGQGSLVQFVLSLNLHRRHLSSSQRAALATEIEPMLAEEAKERQGVRTDIKEILPECDKGQARDKAAELLNTNGKYVSDAKTLKTAAPDLFAQVKSGEKTLPQAKRDLVARNKVDAPPLPESNKY